VVKPKTNVADEKVAKKNKNESGLEASNPSSIISSVINLLAAKIEDLVKEAFNKF